ncbi:PAS domain-containing protein [Denitratisoma oestradiolicum]|uniref:PAS domain S-box n=1 Tax=Denitratisoma oestradiolicum TaxID=311182 RepID=A0A6S6XUK9_9PROT|nr:PAS domain-containing protein [Denitratisoma oestradiolicum]TWO81337.1 aerotaxis receptor Aer [Denitratisoma oestradiolicum]CAB1368530.1 PAS domain S-box [Denitratisoma oestradiolicum]
MKDSTILPTQVERLMREGDYIISTTDLTGRITSVNDVLVEYSGYSEAELIGSQHNILRHPDMPRAIFWLLWEAISHGEDFSAYLKNMSKDGGFYWVFAHISPVADEEGRPLGYKSIRRRPRRAAVDAVEALYCRMLAAERAVGSKDAVNEGLTMLGDMLAARRRSYEEFVAAL